MKRIEKWQWRTKWAGRWSIDKRHQTWEEVSREHPEAERVPGSMKIVEVPDTDEERQAIEDSFRRPPKEFR